MLWVGYPALLQHIYLSKHVDSTQFAPIGSSYRNGRGREYPGKKRIIHESGDLIKIIYRLIRIVTISIDVCHCVITPLKSLLLYAENCIEITLSSQRGEQKKGKCRRRRKRPSYVNYVNVASTPDNNWYTNPEGCITKCREDTFNIMKKGVSIEIGANFGTIQHVPE